MLFFSVVFVTLGIATPLSGMVGQHKLDLISLKDRWTHRLIDRENIMGVSKEEHLDRGTERDRHDQSTLYEVFKKLIRTLEHFKPNNRRVCVVSCCIVGSTQCGLIIHYRVTCSFYSMLYVFTVGSLVFCSDSSSSED